MSEQTSRVVFDSCTYDLKCERNLNEDSEFEFSRYDFGLRVTITQTDAHYTDQSPEISQPS